MGRTSRSLFQQVDDGVVIVLRGKGHAHLAGDIGGIVPVVGAGVHLGALQGCGRGGQLGKEQTAVTGKSAAIQVERHRHRICTPACDGRQLVLQVQLPAGTVGMQDSDSGWKAF